MVEGPLEIDLQKCSLLFGGMQMMSKDVGRVKIVKYGAPFNEGPLTRIDQ